MNQFLKAVENLPIEQVKALAVMLRFEQENQKKIMRRLRLIAWAVFISWLLPSPPTFFDPAMVNLEQRLFEFFRSESGKPDLPALGAHGSPNLQ